MWGFFKLDRSLDLFPDLKLEKLVQGSAAVCLTMGMSSKALGEKIGL